MRYLLSESSASILRGLAADRGGVSFEDRRIDRASPARPRPFACRIQEGAGEGGDETHLLCYLPPLCSECIRWEDAALAPQTSLGSVDQPWVDLGEWDASKRVWLAIAPPVDPPAGSTSGGYAGGWALVLAANPPTSLSGHAAYAHLVAAMESGTSGASRFVQYHLGSMLLAGEGDCDIPCPDEYTVAEATGTIPACVAKRYVFRCQHYTKDASGNCQPDTGTGGSEETNIDVPAPPEYALSVSSSSCSKTVSLLRTPCSGSAAQAGDSVTITEPPAIAATSTGSSASGAKAGTVTVTPCGGSPTAIDIYNGAQGARGLVSVGNVELIDSITVYNGVLYRRMVCPSYDANTGALTWVTAPGGITIGGAGGWKVMWPTSITVGGC